jgi:peptide chain release factor subunit 1
VKGFGGIGAMLRYKVNFEQLADYESEDEFYDGMLPPASLRYHSKECGVLTTHSL